MNTISRYITNSLKLEILDFRRLVHVRCYRRRMDQNTSGLAYLQLKEKDPLNLLREWHDEVKKFMFPGLMNLATADKNSVSNRNVVMREILEDGVTFCTPGRGKKCKQIKENSSVAACFVWCYSSGAQRISRQVRLEGVAEELPFEQVCSYFKSEPLYCKIRAHICEQGQPVDWDQLKKKHDDLLTEVARTGRELETPKDYIGYKIKPTLMDFYFSYDNYIADRIVFKKEGDNWTNQRICT